MTMWTAILPIKPWNLAKSRLGLSDDDRVQLARAFSLDTLETLAACRYIERIVVVSAEPGVVAAVTRTAGAVLLQDRPMLARDMLNPAIEQGRRWAQVREPASPVVVVPSDLAALTPGALNEALLRLGDHERAHVPDAEGTGTTLAAARLPAGLTVAYGPGSAGGHSAAGSWAVADVDPRVRRDVDRQTHLAEARDLGLAPCAAGLVDGILRRTLRTLNPAVSGRRSG